LVAPLALRLKGVYQIVLSLGLIFIGQYIFVNWSDLTGGVSGRRAPLNLSIGPLDFANLQFGGMSYSYYQGLFMLVWLFVALCMFLVHLLMKSPAGRHIVALRDAELPATVAGINPARSMFGVFAISSAMGALGGAFYVAQLRFISPEQFNLAMGLNFIILVTIGGLATAWGPVLGALVISSVPVLAARYAEYIPFLKENSSLPDGTWGIPVGQFPVVIYGVLLVLILMFEPRGLTHLIRVFALWITAPFRRARTTDAEATT
ncbi:branched-chain amino acid ABC transporter permease, partial [Microbacterium sp.]|uniref:branched-chain amino acid ABC transporter permease n=1 Tax=Microbacterium sp. TaxID=51671 RepID=UPI003A892D63